MNQSDPWRWNIACRELALAPLFDEPTNERGMVERIEKAKTFCARCPVAAPCLEEAIKHKDSGVRGGLLLDNGVAVTPTRKGPGREQGAVVDEVVVEMAMQGLRVDLNGPEKIEATMRLHEKGLTSWQIANRLHMNYTSVKQRIVRQRKKDAA